jgi:hypothetical protein
MVTLTRFDPVEMIDDAEAVAYFWRTRSIPATPTTSSTSWA